LSSGECMIGFPRAALFEWGIQDGEPFAYAGSEDNLLGLARLLETGIKDTEDRVVAHGHRHGI